MPEAPIEPVYFADPEVDDTAALADRIASRMRVPKQVKTMDRRALLAMGAALSLNPDFSCPPERRGIVLSQPHTDGAYPQLTEALGARPTSGGDFRALARRFPPLWLTWHLPNMAAAHLAAQFECRGPVHSLNAEWTGESGALAIAETCLQGREADTVLQVHIDQVSGGRLQACARLISGPTSP